MSRKLQVLKPEGYDGTMRWLATQLGPGDHQADGFEGPAFDSAFDTAVDTETLYITAKDVLPSLLNLALRAGTLAVSIAAASLDAPGLRRACRANCTLWSSFPSPAVSSVRSGWPG